MDNLVPLLEIKKSEPSITGKEVLEIFYAYVENEEQTWLAYRSDINIGTALLAQLYANKHGLIETQFVKTFSHSPLHVLREYNTTINLDGVEEEASLDGIMFSNGAVFLLETLKGIRTFLWVAPQTAQSFNYPTPEALIDKST